VLNEVQKAEERKVNLVRIRIAVLLQRDATAEPEMGAAATRIFTPTTRTRSSRRVTRLLKLRLAVEVTTAWRDRGNPRIAARRFAIGAA
jgi:hypothetical protein